MPLAAGDKVLMEFSTFGDRFLCVVTEVGEHGRLFVYAPVPQPVVKRMARDRTARVRFAHEGVLRGFDTRVLNRDYPPGVILELAGPGRVYDAEDRVEPRCRCRFPALVADGAGRAVVRGVVEDMSASCTRVRLSDEGFLSGFNGTEVRLTFHPFDPDEGFTVVCTVRKSFLKNSIRYLVLEFSPGEADARQRIARFVEAQLRCGEPRL
ncbi:PilZ domain-containing protein [Pseudodesulfovibrio pelocollis]|uniref:PilZ domain-containing protein n=1 Tax=Pseudodesulfovibrio pelocollis TaxID=3051432 RepID=UPI00255A85EC|nr:PilZ domain-containing protein [Pseudodesulfovibrio sp. SB368]